MLLAATINWHSTLFVLFALVACGFAAAVLLTSNIVRMAFYLTLSLGAVSGLFFLAGAEFVGSMQLLIYVGGTLVLLIFGVMLTAQSRFISMKTGAGEWIIGAIVGSTLLLLLLLAAFSVEDWRTPRPDQDQLALADSKSSTAIGMALSGVRVDKLNEPSTRLRAGMSGYLLPFVIVSMHLLVVLIGAAYMARTKRLGAGRVLERAAPAAVPRNRRRSFAIAGGLVSGMVVNLILAALCCYLISQRPLPTSGDSAPANAALRSLATAINAAPDWLLPTLGLLFLVNVILLVVVWYWQQWGVFGLALIPFIQVILLVNAGFSQPIAIGFAIVVGAPVVLLIVLLTSGPRPTAWSQMD
jgi:NADH-quinone oxidoreductase subunit J